MEPRRAPAGGGGDNRGARPEPRRDSRPQQGGGTNDWFSQALNQAKKK